MNSNALRRIATHALLLQYRMTAGNLSPTNNLTPTPYVLGYAMTATITDTSDSTWIAPSPALLCSVHAVGNHSGYQMQHSAPAFSASRLQQSGRVPPGREEMLWYLPAAQAPRRVNFTEQFQGRRYRFSDDYGSEQSTQVQTAPAHGCGTITISGFHKQTVSRLGTCWTTM